MVKKIVFVLFVLGFILINYAQSAPFNKGVNLTNWFQVNNAEQIQFTKYTKSDFGDIKSLGVDVIRLPINIHKMVTNTDDYELDQLFLTFLDEVVDWAEELEIHLILDNHTFNSSISTDPDIKNILIPVWKNMAIHFKDRSNLIYFEILNEPHGISDSVWNSIQGEVISAIREIDTVHTLIVGPTGFNNYRNLNAMPRYEDNNLIYTFHFYDPFLFTHQGASWTNPSMVSLENIPFPYNQSKMPPFPSDLNGTWIQSSFNNYKNDGTVEKVRELLDIAVNFKNQRGVPLFCGEFGVLMNKADDNNRNFWHSIVRSYLESKDISWTVWDYQGAYGLFKQVGDNISDQALNVDLLKSLSFNVPTQTELISKPDTTGFMIYSDYIAENFVNASYNNGTLDFYSTNSIIGDYSVYWSSPFQYNYIGFKFTPVKDLSVLLDKNYNLGFWLKVEKSNAKIELRFIDTKDSEDDYSWRMGYTLDFTNTIFNNEWNFIEIPLSKFQEFGTWYNDTWFNPIGLFDWSSVDRFEIVNEHNTLSNTNLWVDEISLYHPNKNIVK